MRTERDPGAHSKCLDRKGRECCDLYSSDNVTVRMPTASVPKYLTVNK